MSKSRTIIIDDTQSVKNILQKGEHILMGRKLTAEIEKLENERAKCGALAQKFQDKIISPVTKAMKGKLNEFEEIGSITVKSGKLEVTVINVIEEFKEVWQNKNEKV